MATTYINRRKVETTWVVTEIGDDGIAVNVWLCGENDRTAGLHVDYDSRCSWCYLGYAHSQLAHRSKLAPKV